MENVATQETEMDPNQVIGLNVCSIANANKETKTRWGVVKFSADGVGELKVPLKDVKLVDSLGWLSKEDKEQYLGVEIVEPTTSQDADLRREFEAMERANTKMAQKNASLEAEIERYEEKFKSAEAEYMKYQKQIDERFDALGKELAETRNALNAALAENTQLKAQLPTEETPSTEAVTKGEKPSNKHGKSR